jgi:hypothetical protein
MNVLSCFESIFKILESQQVVHQVLMLDELKAEERPCLDEETNKILGLCREHGKNTSLEFNSEKEVELLLEAIDKGEVHLASEVVFEGPVYRTEKNRRTEPNRTSVQSFFWLRLPTFGVGPVAGCLILKIFENR